MATMKNIPDANSIKMSSRSFDLPKLPLYEVNDYLKRKTIIIESVFQLSREREKNWFSKNIFLSSSRKEKCS